MTANKLAAFSSFGTDEENYFKKCSTIQRINQRMNPKQTKKKLKKKSRRKSKTYNPYKLILYVVSYAIANRNISDTVISSVSSPFVSVRRYQCVCNTH